MVEFPFKKKNLDVRVFLAKALQQPSSNTEKGQKRTFNNNNKLTSSGESQRNLLNCEEEREKGKRVREKRE